MNHDPLPVAVIGAGPVGLAAAAHLNERGIPFVVFEVGDDVVGLMRIVDATAHEPFHRRADFGPDRLQVETLIGESLGRHRDPHGNADARRRRRTQDSPKSIPRCQPSSQRAPNALNQETHP